MTDLTGKKQKLICYTEGCGHDLEYHIVAPAPRCRVTGCQCDKWRPTPPPKEIPFVLPSEVPEQLTGHLLNGKIVVVFMSDWTMEAALLELHRAVSGNSVQVVAMTIRKDPEDDQSA